MVHPQNIQLGLSSDIEEEIDNLFESVHNHPNISENEDIARLERDLLRGLRENIGTSISTPFFTFDIEIKNGSLQQEFRSR